MKAFQNIIVNKISNRLYVRYSLDIYFSIVRFCREDNTFTIYAASNDLYLGTKGTNDN